ncbi:MAG: cysS [Parcubacteria group bacterium]|nr:cysS [Parcubacteria group bacterium]
MTWISRLFSNAQSVTSTKPASIFLTNTLSGSKELFISQQPGIALMYSCGPTVYGPAHIGNLRAYVFADTLARTLLFAGYRVKRVINITDFGHLVSDGDEGEDKMTKGLKREGLKLSLENMRALAERYSAVFLTDLEELNIDIKDIRFPRASDYIAEQIALIKTLEEKGYAYQTSGGVYYDTARFLGYGKLGGIDLSAQREGTRIEANKEKRSPADFVLWKPDSKLGWESPWGLGFPGWHIECSAMSRSLLGQEIDLHTGGEDHIAVHHNNEIAQSEAASGRTFVHYWLHNAFLTMNNDRVAKSTGNVAYLADVLEKKIHPLALRYFFLQGHYRTPLSFSWEALEGSAEALNRLWKLVSEIGNESKRKSEPSEVRDRLLAALRDDLATPQALGILWESLRSDEYTPEEKWGLIEDADAHLGLSLLNPPLPVVVSQKEAPEEIQHLLVGRETARASKDFAEADRLRDEIEKRGYRVEDSESGPKLTSV